MNEIDRDDWNQHWQDYGQVAKRNPAQTYRLELTISLLGIQGAGEGVRLLDVGSGTGDMAAAVRSRYPAAQIAGFELSQSGVALSSRKVPGARFVQRNLLEEQDPSDDLRNWATHAICAEVIEHLDDPCLLLKNARLYMQNTCRLVLTAPGGPMSAFDRHIGHRTHWQRRDVDALLRAAGYDPEHVSGVGFPFFNLYRSLVILRGRKLVDDIGPTGEASWPARLAMAAFHALVRPSLNSSRWGWQMVAVARPRPTSA
jgi:SAM-dependent methyltransferase